MYLLIMLILTILKASTLKGLVWGNGLRMSRHLNLTSHFENVIHPLALPIVKHKMNIIMIVKHFQTNSNVFGGHLMWWKTLVGGKKGPGSYTNSSRVGGKLCLLVLFTSLLALRGRCKKPPLLSIVIYKCLSSQ